LSCIRVSPRLLRDFGKSGGRVLASFSVIVSGDVSAVRKI